MSKSSKQKKSKIKSDLITKWLKVHLWMVMGLMVGFILTLLVMMVIWWWYSARPWPGVQVAGKYVGNTSFRDIVKMFSTPMYSNSYLVLATDKMEWKLNLVDLGWKIEAEQTAEMAVGWGKNWHDFDKLMSIIDKGVDLPLIYSIDQQKLDKTLDGISEELFVPAISPEVSIDENGEVYVLKGSVGQEVDRSELKKLIHDRLSVNSSNPILIEINEVDLTLDSSELMYLEQVAGKLIKKELVIDLGSEDDPIIWTGEDLVSLLGYGLLDDSRLMRKLDVESENININPLNATFIFNEDDNRVEEFNPEVIGRSVDVDRMEALIHDAFNLLVEEATDSARISMEFEYLYPEVRTADINNLGIEELLGKGVSQYKGSIAGRKYNVSLGAQRISGSLVKPGEVFSFNENVGEVSAATGYKKSYVIKSGETVLDDGGGMCQVSTTVFRAALDAGLPIVERKPHSYRVYYYEQDAKPGLDATVYAPSVDLKFLNNTPAHILVQTIVDESIPELIVEIYGTSDGRKVEISDPRVWDVTEPPEDLFVDDPSLPPGETKQIEHKAWGAKSAFDWKVIRDGEILIEKTFFSSYRPWQAVYMRGIGE